MKNNRNVFHKSLLAISVSALMLGLNPVFADDDDDERDRDRDYSYRRMAIITHTQMVVVTLPVCSRVVWRVPLPL